MPTLDPHGRSADVSSFDIFDTLLVRRIGHPSGVHLLQGQRLFRAGTITLTPEQFAQERELAFFRLRRRFPRRDPSLDSIYAELGAFHGWGEDTQRRLLEAELEVESLLIRPWPPGVEKLQQDRERGDRIAFVSDTPLPSIFLRERLRAYGLYGPDDRLFVSCESGGTKIDGTLFPIVLEALGPSPRSHAGNDVLSDGDAARRAGFEVTILHQGNLNRFEQLLDEYRASSGGLATALAGASRLARAGAPATCSAGLVELASGVAAPTLVGFVLWVLRQATDQGINRLYFLSREGQGLLAIAQQLVERLGLGLDLRYLHVSRHSLNLASVREVTRSELAWTLTHRQFDTPRSLLSRLGLHPADVADAASADLGEIEWDTVPTGGHDRLLDVLLTSPIVSLIEDRARERRAAVLPYLRHAGVFDDVPIGLVDSGGVGSQIRALDILRTESTAAATRGYLFLRSSPSRGTGQAVDERMPPVQGYFSDEAANSGLLAVPGMLKLLEIFLAATHGSVRGYRFDTDPAQMVVFGPLPSSDELERISVLRDQVKRFVDHLLLNEELVDLGGDVRHAIGAVVRELWTRPRPHEAAALASSRFESGSSTGEAPALASPISLRQLLPHLVARRRCGPAHPPYWSAGSLAVSDRPTRAVYGIMRAFWRFARRLRALRGVAPRF